MIETKTVIGLYLDEDDAQGAIETLQREGFDAKDISLIMRDERRAEEIQNQTGVGEGAVSGAATGGVIGGLAGLLIGIGAFTIPGVGAFLIGGPLAAALGLTGAVASTATGALTGAVAGGILGALISLGLPKEDAEHYETLIREGAILLAVPVNEREQGVAERIMAEYHATDIKVLDAHTDEETETHTSTEHSELHHRAGHSHHR